MREKVIKTIDKIKKICYYKLKFIYEGDFMFKTPKLLNNIIINEKVYLNNLVFCALKIY